MIASCLLQLSLFITDDLFMTYIIMIGFGMTFSGRNIVGLNLLMEYLHLSYWQEYCIISYMFLDPVVELYFTFHYYSISKNWKTLQTIFLILAIIDTGLIYSLFPESPKFLYSQGKFAEARRSLNEIAK